MKTSYYIYCLVGYRNWHLDRVGILQSAAARLLVPGACARALSVTFTYTRAIWKVRGLTLLLRVWTLWRCGDDLFFKAPPLVSDAVLTTLHPLLENLNGVIRWVHELFIWSSYLLRHPKKCSFKTTLTQTMTTIRGMKITPLLFYPHYYNLA
jgi:hypothetical protein